MRKEDCDQFMGKSLIQKTWGLGIATLATFITNPAFAQLNIIPDTAPNRSLGTTIEPSANPRVDIITGGIRPSNGINLFHSFQEFNVREGKEVYFAHPRGVQNILARVTGNDASDILGTLGTARFVGGVLRRSDTNLFLINPNGIIFGKNALLNIGGSFVATTANAVQFGEQGFFSATNPETQQLLTVNPSAFVFNQIAAQGIINQSVSGLLVPNGKSLLLLGGDINLDGGSLFAPNGRVDLGGVAKTGTVGLNMDGSNLSLSFPDNVVRADISLSNGSKITSLNNFDEILPRLVNFDLINNEIVDTPNLVDIFTAITLLRFLVANGRLLDEGSGNVNLQASTVYLQDAAQITAENISIRVSDSLIMTGGSVIQPAINPLKNRGSINIQAGRTVSLTDGSTFLSATDRRGNSGDITIKAGERVLFDGVNSSGRRSGINSSVNPGQLSNTEFTFEVISQAIKISQEIQTDYNPIVFDSLSRRAGNISIETESLSITNGGAIVSNIETDPVSFSNGFTIVSGRVGQGGNIDIKADSINLTNDGQISATNQGQGSAGNITINTRGPINLTNSNISTSATQSSGGAINISAKDIRLGGDSDITTFVNSGSGGGGNITLSATSILAFNDSDILAFAQDGKGGDITLNTRAFFGQNYRPAPSSSDPRTLDRNSRVDINATGAVSGIIRLPDTSFIQNSLNQLAENPIDANALIASSCIARRNNQDSGTFFITGKGGLPERPRDAPVSSFSTGTMQNIPKNGESATRNSPWKIGDPIIEPTGVYRLTNGKFILSRECY